MTGKLMITEKLPKDFPKDKTEQEYKDLLFDVQYDKEQFKDPMTMGLLLYRLSKEREKTNLLFQRIIERLDALGTVNTTGNFVGEPTVIAEIDQKILNHLHEIGKGDAGEIRSFLGYKGSNAASARLNYLFDRGLLLKKRAGKKVYYWVKESSTEANDK